MSECIHGLDEQLCDVCSPKPAPAAPPPAPKRTSSRRSAATPRARRPSTARVPGDPAAGMKPVDVSAHRIFHLTHVRNIAGIADSGALVPHGAGAQPEFDISAPDHREQRRTTTLPEMVTAPDATAVGVAASAETGADVAATVDSAARTVADCVPFFATPESALWADLRTGAPDPRLSASARKSSAADYVLLATTVGEVEKAASLVLALDEASDPSTPMTADPAAVRKELRRLIALDDADADDSPLAGIELLAVGSVPIESVSLIGVANSKARDEVKEVLRDAGLDIRVAVYPPWFVRA